jgi:hypothetical protein
MIITPFQIFCYQTRDQAAQANPHLKGIAVTALLGRMWRALESQCREHFVDLSLKLRGYPVPKIVSGPGKVMTDATEKRISFEDVFAVPLNVEKIGTVQHRKFVAPDAISVSG